MWSFINPLKEVSCVISSMYARVYDGDASLKRKIAARSSNGLTWTLRVHEAQLGTSLIHANPNSKEVLLKLGHLG
ncbi:hypothetical protein JHK85_010122 [Glycine max]|nr:hypothetical protein JHK85_010122 [Glycine max]